MVFYFDYRALTNMTLPTSLAIAGIWIGVGLSAFGAHEAVVGVALFAMIATIAVVTQ